MEDSCRRMEMPVFPKERFLDAVRKTVHANRKWVPPYGSGASLYLRPYLFGTSPIIGVHASEEYQFRLFASPVRFLPITGCASVLAFCSAPF